MVKRMHSGMSARSGVLAAALAGAGFTGIKRVLERDFGGFVKTFCGGDPFDLSRLTNGLGKQWEVMRIAVKPAYSAMAGSHSALRGAVKLPALPGVSVGQVPGNRIGPTQPRPHHGGLRVGRPGTANCAQTS